MLKQLYIHTLSHYSPLSSLPQSSPLLSVEPSGGYLFSLQWSPTRPLVFALATADGQVVLYDLKVGISSSFFSSLYPSSPFLGLIPRG